MNISEKIKVGRENKGWTQAELATGSGVSLDSIKRYESKNSNITIENLIKIADALEVDLNFFRSDEFVTKLLLSPVTKSQKVVTKLSPSHINLSPNKENSPQTLNKKTNLTLNEDSIRIPFYENIIASAGQGYINEESQPKYITFSKSYLRDILGIFSVNNLSIITSSGDSMHPTIPTNCNVIIEHTQPKNGDICVTRIDDELYIKRLQKLPKMRLLSDNTNYEAIDLETQNYEIIGKVLCYIKRV